MIEVLVLVLLGQKLGNKALSRGLSRNYGWLILPFWIIPEFLGAFVMTLAGADMTLVYLVALGCAAIGAVVAFQVVGHMGAGVAAPPILPPTHAAPGVPLPPVAPVAAPVARAGFCSQCGENVWLTAAGSCPRGHGAECISGHYSPAG